METELIIHLTEQQRDQLDLYSKIKKIPLDKYVESIIEKFLKNGTDKPFII